ncbi:MAG: hypothetical protein R8G66_24120 [Cytophagales bacterium]|nr:hypothetical protein [Cytophagales bacterium]
MNSNKKTDSSGNPIEIREKWIATVFNFRTFLMLIVSGAMINNLDHSAHLYMKISTSVSLYHAYSVVIIFDLIVFALIWIGDSKAVIFAISIFFINELAWDGVVVFYELFYRFSNPEQQIDPHTRNYLELITKAVTMLIYGGTFAFTVHHFSELFKAQIMKRSRFNKLVNDLRIYINKLRSELTQYQTQLKSHQEKELELTGNNDELNKKLSSCEEKLTRQEQLNTEQQDELENLRNFKEQAEKELICICGKSFKDMSSKFGHQRKCKVYKASQEEKLSVNVSPVEHEP